jgi:hypothetical protein
MTTPVEIRIANMATPADVVSGAISRALVNKVVLLPFVFAEDLPVGTPVKQARKDDALGLGAIVSEAANYTHVAGTSNLTQTKVQLTAAKTVISTKITEEAKQFTEINDATVISKQSNSLARTLDNAVKVLSQGLSQNVDAGATMSAEALMEAVMLLSAGNAASDMSPAVAALSPQAILHIQTQLVQSGASAWSNIQMLSLLQDLEKPNGFRGSLPGGVDVYSVNGMPDSGKSGMVFNPELCFFGIYGTVQIRRKASDSQGLYDELTSFVFNQVAEWNDAAGVEVTYG